MKKTFYQLHIGMFLAACIILIFIVFGIYLIFEGVFDTENLKNDILEIALGVGVIVFMIYSFINSMFNRIICLENKIKVTGDKGAQNEKVQFEDEIIYSEISNIKIVLSEKNSQKNPIHTFYNFTPRLYYEFLLKDGNTKWILIAPFSKKQRKEMLEIINSKTGKNFSYDSLEKEDLSIYSKIKSQNK